MAASSSAIHLVVSRTCEFAVLNPTKMSAVATRKTCMTASRRTAELVQGSSRQTARNTFPDIAQRNWTMMHVELPLVLRLFRVPRSARILDLGCGRGFGMAALTAQGFRNLIGV